MKHLITTLLTLFLVQTSMAQQEDYYVEDYFRYADYVYDTNIHSLQVYPIESEMSAPVVEFSETMENRLVLSFDDFRDQVKDYNYTFIHCDANWKPSPLRVNEYLSGFEYDYIEDYRFSYNTRQSFIHYRLEFPQDDMRPTLTGNYILKVFPDGQPDKPVLSARFILYTLKVGITTNIRQATAPTKMRAFQEVDFTLDIKTNAVINPSRNLKVVIQQNGREDNKITNLQPSNISQNKLEYDYEDKNLFAGGNQYRYFDIQNFKYQSDQVQRIDFFNLINKVDLHVDKRRLFSPYVFYEDLNGKRLIKTTEFDDTDIEADYAYVHFTLPMKAPVIDGGIYILGELNNWQMNEKNLMTYNYRKKAYETDIYLKQGYYSYLYAYLEDGQQEASIQYIEGSFGETENEYSFFVYYRSPGTLYDQLIGYTNQSTAD